MKTPSLIQRCKLRHQPNNKPPGFDENFSCDYMGSAEFEYGSVPTSLKHVTTNLVGYSVFKTAVKVDSEGVSKGVFLVGAGSEKMEVLNAFELVWAARNRDAGSVRLKERVWLGPQLDWNGKPFENSEPVVLLWDIENHWFACLGKDTAKLLQKSLAALRKRWIDEGKIT